MVDETEQPGEKTLTLDGLPLICNTLTPGFDPGMASESFNQRLLTLKRLFLNRYKKVSEYDQEIPQSQTADNPVAPRGRAAQPSRETRKTN